MTNLHRLFALSAVSLVIGTTACSSLKKATSAQGPRTTADSSSYEREAIRRDSILAAQAAMQDSINRARALEDSLRLAREAEQRAAASLADARAVIGATIYFDYDQSGLTDAARDALNGKISVLRANPTIKLRITGHTDERGADEYNLALGLRRASETKQYLIAGGVENGRLEINSLGEEAPAVQGDVEEAYARNRRAEFEIINGELQEGVAQ